MATYAFEAMNSSGQEVKDEIEADSSEEAIAKIRAKGYFPTKVREKAAKKKVARRRKTRAGAVGAEAEDADLASAACRASSSSPSPASSPRFRTPACRFLRSLQILEQQQKPGLLKAIIGGVAR